MVDELTKCPTCKTRTLKREGDELVCTECKGHFPAPNADAVALGRRGGAKGGKVRMAKLTPEQRSELAKKAVNTRWNRVNNNKRHLYYEQHREEIVKDLLSLGVQAARTKWSIPPSTITYLAARWLTNEQRAQLLMTEHPPGPIKGNGYLPVFPPFSDDWPESVQLKWLELYGLLQGTRS
jgi:hypothetical protein